MIAEGQSLSHYRSIFVDVCNHAHYTLNNRAYFVSLIFGDTCSSLSVKISLYMAS